MLDQALLSFSRVLNINPSAQGYGAAGGVGAAILSVLGGSYISGASLMVESCSFKNELELCDLLITGEGNTDAQTAYGKLVSVVLAAAKSYNKTSVVLSGGLSDGYEKLRDIGATDFYSLLDANNTLEYCITHAYEMLCDKAYEIVVKYIK